MPPIALLTYYCALILVASIVGGMIPVWFQLTHRWMQFAVSFVAGVMLGIGVLHMLPHAIVDLMVATPATQAAVNGAISANNTISLQAINTAMIALLTGMLAMFFIERFFSYHHHDVEQAGSQPEGTRHGAWSKTGSHESLLPAPRSPLPASHDLSWSGAALGLALHSVLNGVALAAAVEHGSDGSWLAGFGTFLVIALHKPFDAMTIGMLMAHGGWSLAWRHTVNALFSMAIPLGVMLFNLGLASESGDASDDNKRYFIACALAFSAGTFLCISLSDLLPELQFHHHDRIKLSAALLLGLAVAYAAGRLESAAHNHSHAPVGSASRAAPESKTGRQRDTGTRRFPRAGLLVSPSPPSPTLPLFFPGNLYQAYPTGAGRLSIQLPAMRSEN
jgi:zinc and cadmium transporter